MDDSRKALLENVDAERDEVVSTHIQTHGRLSSIRSRWNAKIHRIHLVVESCLLIALLYLTLDCVMLRKNFWKQCLESTSVPSPMLHLSSEVKTVVFDGSFATGSSAWRQPPSPNTDELWENYIGDTFVALSFDQVRAMGKTPENLVRVPPHLREKYGNGILAEPEFSHQIHCLNMIRKYTYFDHYQEELEAFNSSPAVLRTHIDHCIDALRQVLMCNPDTALTVSYWIEGRKVAMPDFNTKHTCRNIDKMMGWYKDHSVRGQLAGPYPDEKIWRRGEYS